MPRLALSLLGSFQATLDGQPVVGFESDKVRALLAYLAVESDRPHSREKLAGLLWPDSSEHAARANLSQALTNLRRVLGDRDAEGPVLLVSRQSIQFNREGDAFVDVLSFSDLSGLADPKGLEQAAALYRGRFLEGFSLPGCAEFEEWLLFEQEHLHRLALDALARLAEGYEGREELERALAFAWRQLKLDPWRESAQRQVMRLLARTGQRDAALAQYQTCCRLLADELGAEPSQETVRLYEQIRDGKMPAWRPEPSPSELGALPLVLPGFLAGQAPTAVRPAFVARDKELTWLNGLLEQALSGRGQAAFVAGGPGRGKTVLLQEFARRALDAQPELLLAMGTCNAYSGVGDPYLPFRGALAMLTGDVEAQWAGGILSTEQARRMWDALHDAAPVLARWGSGLVGTLLPGRELLERARAVSGRDGAADWLSAIERLADPWANPPGGLEQSHLFEQYANVLLNLSAQHPLLLILDDLQWVDQASIGLLFHLGRRIERGRILLAGAYRPHELALGRDGERHPLEPVVGDFRARFGDVWLDLAASDEAEGRLFVDRFLDSEPNALDERFREALFSRTRGHPLFTVELLRAMQQRGDLVQDLNGRWAQSSELEWEALPARVEAAIAERVERLPHYLRDMLAVASVEGEEFLAQVVALAQGMDELQALRTLRQLLGARHRLVREQGELRVDGRSLSRYRFSHFLVQHHLYQGLGEAERRLLHRRVGEALERLYEGRVEEVAVELVRHFAGDAERERRYARLAGERAAAQFANEEAVRYLSRALELTTGDQARERYELLLAREKVLDLLGRRDDQRRDLDEAERLVASEPGFGAEEQAVLAMRRVPYALAVGDYPAAIATGQKAVETAQAGRPTVPPAIEAWCHYWLGQAHLLLDQGAPGAQQLEAALELARRAGDRQVEGQALARLGQLRLWVGDHAKAEELLATALAVAREAGDKATEALSTRSLSDVLWRVDRLEEAAELVETSRALYEQMGDRPGVAYALGQWGEVAYAQGDHQRAERCFREAVALLGNRDRNTAAFLDDLFNVAFDRGALEEARGYAEQERAVGEELGVAFFVFDALLSLGIVAEREGKLSEARALFEECCVVAEQCGNPVNVPFGQARLGYVVARQGDLNAAWNLFVRALRFFRSANDPSLMEDAIWSIGRAAVYAAHWERAAELLGLSFRLAPKVLCRELRSEPELDMLREALGEEALQAALARGAALDMEQVVADILACETPEAYWGSGTAGAAGMGEQPQP